MKNRLQSLMLAALLVPVIPAAMAQEKAAEETDKATDAAKEAVEPASISRALDDSANFSILVKALKAADLHKTLGEKGSYTLFAPTDEAFSKLPEGTLDQLLLPENKERLRSLLMFHVIHGNLLSADLKDGDVQTSNGEKIEIDVDSDGIEIGDAKVASSDLVLSNGVVHSIDKVIVPESLDGFAKLDDD